LAIGVERHFDPDAVAARRNSKLCNGVALTMTRRFLLWFFRNRKTGAITIAQAPNLVLWIAIVGSVLIWIWHPPGRLGVVLEIIVKGGLFVWAIDEIWRGVNPFRRFLGVAVLFYVLVTIYPWILSVLF
jgi:hypothetical protein